MLMSLNDRLSRSNVEPEKPMSLSDPVSLNRSNVEPEKPMSLSDPMWLSHLSDLSHEA